MSLCPCFIAALSCAPFFCFLQAFVRALNARLSPHVVSVSLLHCRPPFCVPVHRVLLVMCIFMDMWRAGWLANMPLRQRVPPRNLAAFLDRDIARDGSGGPHDGTRGRAWLGARRHAVAEAKSSREIAELRVRGVWVLPRLLP